MNFDYFLSCLFTVCLLVFEKNTQLFFNQNFSETCNMSSPTPKHEPQENDSSLPDESMEVDGPEDLSVKKEVQEAVKTEEAGSSPKATTTTDGEVPEKDSADENAEKNQVDSMENPKTEEGIVTADEKVDSSDDNKNAQKTDGEKSQVAEDVADAEVTEKIGSGVNDELENVEEAEKEVKKEGDDEESGAQDPAVIQLRKEIAAAINTYQKQFDDLNLTQRIAQPGISEYTQMVITKKLNASTAHIDGYKGKIAMANTVEQLQNLLTEINQQIRRARQSAEINAMLGPPF